MDERTRAATYQDVRRIAELLESEGVELKDRADAQAIRNALGLPEA